MENMYILLLQHEDMFMLYINEKLFYWTQVWSKTQALNLIIISTNQKVS